MDWYALFCEPSKERMASDFISREEPKLTTFFPHTLEWQGLGTAFAHLVHRAYYPRYLFAYGDLSDLNGCWYWPGVIGVVRSTDRIPFRIAQEALQPVLDKTDHLGSVHEIPASRVKYGLLGGHVGKTMTFGEGTPLWNMVATIAAVDGESITATMGRLKVRLRRGHIGELERRGKQRPDAAEKKAPAMRRG